MARSLRQRALVVCALALTAGAISLVSPAIAGAADLGFKGPNTSGNSNPTAEKPESKLWFNDGIWWGALWDSASPRRHEIFRLDTGTQTWTSTNVPIDSRAGTHVDALWDGTKLYVASHIFTTSPKLGGPSNLYRYSYNAATDTYTLDPGFPAVINSENTEALVIDRDSFGNLWATWMRAGQVRVSHTSGNDAVWGAPFVLPTSGAANATTDDMSSLIAFSGRIGVMYSNQNDDTMHFAVHVDGAADSAWTHENAYGSPGSNKADDHINLKTFGGKVYAATKTSLGGSNPLVNLLVRDANGIWTDHLFGTAVSTQDHTRPIVLIDATSGVVHMFATGSSPGSTTYDLIYEKTSPLANISFAPGAGTPFIDPDGSTPQVNNATSTKQNLTSGMGLVVIASGGSNYWHNTPLVPDTTPPVIQSAVANGATLTMTYNELAEHRLRAGPGAFAVTGGHSVTGVNVTGTTVVLTLSPAVTAGETGLTLSYTKGTNPIEDLAGNDADNLTDAAVTNNTPPVDGTTPVFQSAAVNGSALTMTYNEALNTGSVPANGDFTISAGHSVTNRSVTGSTVVLTISPAAVNGEMITLSYTKGTNPIEDLAGNDADNLTDAAVTNNTPPPGGGSLDAPAERRRHDHACGNDRAERHGDAVRRDRRACRHLRRRYDLRQEQQQDERQLLRPAHGHTRGLRPDAVAHDRRPREDDRRGRRSNHALRTGLPGQRRHTAHERGLGRHQSGPRRLRHDLRCHADRPHRRQQGNLGRRPATTALGIHRSRHTGHDADPRQRRRARRHLLRARSGRQDRRAHGRCRL